MACTMVLSEERCCRPLARVHRAPYLKASRPLELVLAIDENATLL
jgi:hypothetical protein